MNLDPAVFITHDRLGGVLKEGMLDALGRAAMEAVFARAGVSLLGLNHLQKADLGSLLLAMQALFGPRAGQGLAVCTGRACFKYGLKAFGAELGWYDNRFRLRPPAARIEEGLDAIATVMRPVTASEICIDQDCGHTYLHMQPGAASAGASTVSACHMLTGILQEFHYWAGGGRYYAIEEKTCILRGAAACLLSIDKQPLD